METEHRLPDVLTGIVESFEGSVDINRVPSADGLNPPHLLKEPAAQLIKEEGIGDVILAGPDAQLAELPGIGIGNGRVIHAGVAVVTPPEKIERALLRVIADERRKLRLRHLQTRPRIRAGGNPDADVLAPSDPSVRVVILSERRALVGVTAIDRNIVSAAAGGRPEFGRGIAVDGHDAHRQVEITARIAGENQGRHGQQRGVLIYQVGVGLHIRGQPAIEESRRPHHDPGLVAGCSQIHGSRVEAAGGFGGIASIERIADRGSGGCGMQDQCLRAGVESSGEHGDAIGFEKIRRFHPGQRERAGIGRPGSSGIREAEGIAGRVPRPGMPRILLRHVSRLINEQARGIVELHLFPGAGELEIRVQPLADAVGFITAVAHHEEVAVRRDRSRGGKFPLAGQQIIVRQRPVSEIDGGIGSVLEFDPVPEIRRIAVVRLLAGRNGHPRQQIAVNEPPGRFRRAGEVFPCSRRGAHLHQLLRGQGIRPGVGHFHIVQGQP